MLALQHPAVGTSEERLSHLASDTGV